MPRSLYAPVNFVFGLRVWLAEGLRTHAQEAARGAPDAPARRLGVGLLALVLLLPLAATVLDTAIGPVVSRLAPLAPPGLFGRAAAVLMGAGTAWVAFQGLVRFCSFYRRMCLLGVLTREQRRGGGRGG